MLRYPAFYESACLTRSYGHHVKVRFAKIKSAYVEVLFPIIRDYSIDTPNVHITTCGVRGREIRLTQQFR